MLNKLKPKSEFSRNVLTPMTGTIIAKVIKSKEYYIGKYNDR